ncbi:MAG TPA: hypothetical protein VIV65_04075, partial [Gemmatimonadaceae bacterium]
VWPGLFDAQVALHRSGWDANEINTQIARLRNSRESSAESNGHVHFRMRAMLMNGSAIGELLRIESYAQPALVPAAPWLGAAPPAAPAVSGQPDFVQIAAGDSVPVAWWMIQTRMSNGQWRYFLRRATQTRIALATLGDLGGGRIAITAVDRAGQLSAPAVLELQP